MPVDGKLAAAIRQVALGEIDQCVTSGPVELETACVAAGHLL